MASNEKAMVLAAFAGDSLALGVHWIYNTNVIDKKVGRVSGLLKPIVDSWHPNRDKGEFTHYGDQAMVLLESVAASDRFDLHHFSDQWRALFDGYTGYLDKATKATLENFKEGKSPTASGSASTDLGGASRIAAIVYRLWKDPEAMTAAAKAQTAMTHNTPEVIESAAFLAHVTAMVLDGESPVMAMAKAVRDRFNKEPLRTWVEKGLSSNGKQTRAAIAEFGQMCEAEAAFPATVHLISRYENNLSEALIENCMAGGDSASRGMAVGMVLGAWLGMDAIPEAWLADMKATRRIQTLLETMEKPRT